MADASAAPPAPAPAGDPGAQPGEGNAAPGEKAPQQAQARKLRLRGLDGDEEREYDEGHLVGLAKRGKNAAQLVSLAEKKAQEAAKREQQIEERLSRLKGGDVRAARAALKELGVDVRKLSEAEILEAVEEEKLTPEQKRIRTLEREKEERETADADSKRKAEEAQLRQEEETELNAISTTFQEVMELAGLPRQSAVAVGYRLVPLFQAAHAAGVQVDPELAAERVKSALMVEHKALFTGKDGKTDFGAMAKWLGPEAMTELRKLAVQEYLKGRNGGGSAPPQAPAQVGPPAKAPGKQQATGGPRKGSTEWWRQMTGM